MYASEYTMPSVGPMSIVVVVVVAATAALRVMNGESVVPSLMTQDHSILLGQNLPLPQATAEPLFQHILNDAIRNTFLNTTQPANPISEDNDSERVHSHVIQRRSMWRKMGNSLHIVEY